MILFLAGLIITLIITPALVSHPVTAATNSSINKLSNSPKKVKVVIFYGRGCPHCAKAITFLNSIKDKYPYMEVIKKEVYYNQTNRELMQEYVHKHNSEIKGVPTIFVNDKMFVGFSSEIASQLEEEINKSNTHPTNTSGTGTNTTQTNNQHTNNPTTQENKEKNYETLGWIVILILLLIAIYIAIRTYHKNKKTGPKRTHKNIKGDNND